MFRLNFPLLTALLLLLIALNLGIGRGTQTDDAHRVFVPDGVDRHVKAISFGRDADPALLVRLACVIEGDLHRVPVELARQIQRDTVSPTVRLVFLRVELEIPRFIVRTRNGAVNATRADKSRADGVGLRTGTSRGMYPDSSTCLLGNKSGWSP